MSQQLDDYKVIKIMDQYGGRFIKRLADLFLVADDDNRKRLKEAFPEYWIKYSELALLKEKEKV